MADALVRLGGTLRLCVGVLDLFEEADLLAPCQLFNITLDQFTFVISSRATTWTVETTSMCSGRHLLSRQFTPSTFGEPMLDLPRRRQSLMQSSTRATTSKTTVYHAYDSRFAQ